MKLSKAVRAAFSRMGKRSAQARLKKISPRRRKAMARKAAQARWAKVRAAAAGSPANVDIPGDEN